MEGQTDRVMRRQEKREIEAHVAGIGGGKGTTRKESSRGGNLCGLRRDKPVAIVKGKLSTFGQQKERGNRVGGNKWGHLRTIRRLAALTL